MKKNKLFLLIVLIALGATAQPAIAAAPIAQVSGYADSTFTLPIGQADHITVHASNINLTIRRWADSKARLVVTAAPADWEGDLMVTVRRNSDGVLVELGPRPRVNGENGQLSSTWSSIEATLDIPDGHELILGSGFANVDISSDFQMGDFTVNNGDLTARSIPQLELHAQFANVHLNDCQKGNFTVNNGDLTASNIPQLELKAQFANVRLKSCHQASITVHNTTMTIGTADILGLASTFSNIDLETVNQLTFNSNNDELTIGELGEASGHKTFGSFRIGKLRKGFSLFGQNADVSIKEIAATLDTLHIDDQFGRLQLPVDGLPAFSLHFDGMFATVNTSLPHKPVGDRAELNHTEFTINKGGGGGKLASISLHCNNCDVDLE